MVEISCVGTSTAILCFGGIDYNCPYCGSEYSDGNDCILDRINRSRKGYTSLKCGCGKRFGVAVDYTGQLVGFALVKNPNQDLTPVQTRSMKSIMQDKQ